MRKIIIIILLSLCVAIIATPHKEVTEVVSPYEPIREDGGRCLWKNVVEKGSCN